MPDLGSLRSPRYSWPGPHRQHCEIGRTSTEEDVLAKAREAAMGIVEKGSFPHRWEGEGGGGGDPLVAKGDPQVLVPSSKGAARKNATKTRTGRRNCPTQNNRKGRKKTCAQRKIRMPEKTDGPKRSQLKDRNASAELKEGSNQKTRPKKSKKP